MIIFITLDKKDKKRITKSGEKSIIPVSIFNFLKSSLNGNKIGSVTWKTKEAITLFVSLTIKDKMALIKIRVSMI